MDVISVPVTSLDTWMAERGLDPPDLIRMDMEGGEPGALKGMARTLAEHSPDLVVEVLPASETELKDALQRAGYTTYTIGRQGWLHPRALCSDPSLNRDWYATRRPADPYLR
ncbi:MAG: hypothetical protein A3C53_04150 [Omnitrophica WOR_2 bacterium RIFCSPHIGHO2_02_FULL_68_15]|nr:MAG: hypothetical protein A3C53_04150 [Omnitrophica WOR_2 bacterium RIFCSPHIGHO2_02_FULL_68_15]